MLYSNTHELIEFLKQNHLWNKKSMGQNFLVNMEALQKIVSSAEISPQDNIVEVGPGLGILTEALAKEAKHITTIEYDPSLIPILKESLKNYKNIELIHADALTVDLPKYEYKIVANIPYYITSPLLNHFLQPQALEQKRPSLVVLLVQKEVAEKVCAKDGDHSILSLQVQIYGQPKMMGKVGKNSFFPQPKVDSAILKIEMYPKPLITNTEIFFKLIKSAFSQKRKTLLNSMQAGLRMSKEQTVQLFELAKIDQNRRPQTLKIEEWQQLITAYEAQLPHC